MNSDSAKTQTQDEKRSSRRRARTRAEILAAARQVFAARGYRAASIAEIAERADVAVGTFYLHFHDKEEAFTILLQECFNETRSHVQQAVTEEGQSLLVILQAIFRYANAQRDLFRITIHPDRHNTRMDRVQTALTEILTTVLTNANQKTPLVGYDLSMQISFLTGMITQGITQWLEHEDMDPDTIVAQMLFLLRHGLPESVLTGENQPTEA
ncbi:TetR/AcrR family transcriptional regulator [Ktedonospora formicarum]|uniref:HTH tetR-type domain-containing protein n=1 Tax=Ktedonospora formicarum TaxID=2778364 RepID=A0A8J3HRG6_9CHLR|nr:TetR/AcrR family transcriptional regulator [Ktedonospora formicarum]GHO42512.1 hypothetical protein KSX_06750 [Ktedonospora formicarum]